MISIRTRLAELLKCETWRHYRELATEDQADLWFSIVPKAGQWENAFKWDRRARVVTLRDSAGE